MNYYPFHLGDYAAHTAHLEPMEDLAYRRMLDLYYRSEKALPLDVQEIARLTRLRDHVATIRDVLNEFFIRSDDGWHSKRADDELTEMKVKQEQQATKDEHEAERLRRYRARRAEMFEALRAVGVVPPWDVAMKELQRLFDANCNAPETRTGTLSETDSQRLSLPTPTPTPKEEEKVAALPVGTAPPTPPQPFDGLNAQALNGKSVVTLAPNWELPDDWGEDAERLGWVPAEVLREAEKFRQYWVSGKGQGTRRSVKSWRQTWSNWLDKAARDKR